MFFKQYIFKNMNSILIIGAHPDDIELGCVGTALKLKSMGKKIYCLILTKGENWEKKTYKERIFEQNKSFEIESFDGVYIGKYRDGCIKWETEAIDYVSNIIKENSIDTIFSQYYLDSHQDHIAVSHIARSASMYCKNLIYYESLTSLQFYPNFYVDISLYERQKEKMLKSYTSQLEKYEKRNQNLIEYIHSKDKLNGIKQHLDFAEGFIVEKYLLEEL